MTEEQREYRHAFLKVNKHDLFKQKIEDTLETFKNRTTSVITDAPQLSFILFPIIMLTVIGSFIKEASCYLFRVATFDDKLRLAHVRISDEESELLYELDKVQGSTNIELSNMERTRTVIENDPYKHDRKFLSKYMPKFREYLAVKNNKLSINAIDCDNNKVELTFEEQYINKLVALMCIKETKLVDSTSNASYLLVQRNDLIAIQNKLRKVMINDLIKLTLI